MPDPYHHGVGFPLKGTKQDIIDFATHSYGITGISVAASAKLADAAAQFNANYLVTATGVNVLDAIINMPPGFRTKPTLLNLNAVPLGLLCYLLRARMRERYGVTTLFNDLVYSGKVTRFKNIVLQSAMPVENQYRGHEGQPYYTTRIERDVDEFEFRQMPLSRIQFVWPFAHVQPDEAIDTDPPPTINDMHLNLANYMGEFTDQPGGSDVSFFCIAAGGYIFRRYGNMARTGIPAPMRSRMVRTAGLGQVIFEAMEKEVGAYKFYVPASREGNCFEACIKKAILYEQGSLSVREYKQTTEQIDEMLTIVMCAVTQNRDMSVGEYRKTYRNGYPTLELKAISKVVYEKYNYELRLWRKEANGQWKNILDLFYLPKEGVKVITMFQMIDNGEILGFDSVKPNEDSNYYENVDNASLGMMLHAILAYPTPKGFEKSTRSKGKKRDIFADIITSYTRQFMYFIFERNRYWEDISAGDLHGLVDLQNERYEQKQTSTLIFNEQRSKKQKLNSTAETRQWLSRLQKQNGNRPIYYVFAFDLETVDNTAEIQDRVLPMFRREITAEQSEIYDPMESQIPFSAQWVPVNVSDSGLFLQRKKAEPNASILEYDVHGLGDSQKEWYFLDHARSEYSEELMLGECIQVMMVNIAAWTREQGGEYAILYGHNAAAFDNFVTLQFNPFEVTRILKTSRGVMSMSIRVPITQLQVNDYDWRVHDLDVPKVTLTFRDSMLHVPGSLARLCKGFNVPKEYEKLDFPIQYVNAHNCYNNDIMEKLRAYGENDVKALAVIIVRINELIGNSTWQPANIFSVKPPIAQFLTCMAMIRASMLNHFTKIIPRGLFPQAIDVPALRNWLIPATMGGRVNAYMKTYCSPYTNTILNAAMMHDISTLEATHRKMMETCQSMQCLDVTSLYPFVMDSCPMPTGKVKFIGAEEARVHINMIGCFDCETGLRLCEKHRHFYNQEIYMRPFSIILVKDVYFTNKTDFRNMCGRKLYSKTTGKPTSLLYSLENFEEVSYRLPKETLRRTESFTNVDLYWMERQGFRFTIIGGFSFEVTTIYNTFIGPAFKNRIKAKQAGNKILSDFLKLNYNGSFGVTTQQDITENFFMVDIEKEFHNLDPRTPEIRKIVHTKLQNSRNDGLCATEELTGEAYYFRNGQAILQKKKKDHLAEYFCAQSPMQIGAAVLAWSRHVMNLMMFGIPEESIAYTDTDSMAVEDFYARHTFAHLIDNRDTAQMGTLKNDHAENNGTEPRIFLSLIGAKKVKCHFTLNAEGQVRIFNTFKGLHVSCENKQGKKMTAAWAEKITTKTLLEISLTGSAPPVEVQSWKRDLQFGVSIGNHLQYLDSNTYLGDCQGTLVRTTGSDLNARELFVPHGAIVPFMHPDIGVYYPVVRDEHGDPSLGDREEEICDTVFKGVDSVDTIIQFIDYYYTGAETPYHAGTKEYDEILALFDADTL